MEPMEEEEMEEMNKCPSYNEAECKKGNCNDSCSKKKKKMDTQVTKVKRCDVYEDDWNFSFKETPEGYLIGKAVVTNIGVFQYMNADGSIRRELRLPEEVFKFDSMWSLRGKPITNDHPSERVTVDNIKELAVGKTEGDPIFDSYFLSIGLVFDDKDAIQAIKNGKRALSCGYDCELEMVSGNFMGTPYDAIQRNITYNHISLVDKGRAGDAAMIRLDSTDAYIVHSNEGVQQVSETLRTITLDSVDYKAEDKVIDAYKAALAHVDELKATKDSLVAEKSTIQAEKDALREKLDTLQKDFDEMKANHIDKAEVDALVQARISLREVAKKAKVEVKDSDSDHDIMVAVVKTLAPKAKLDGADEAYIQMRYKIVVEDMEEVTQEVADAANRLLNAQPKLDSEPTDSAESRRQAMEERIFGKKK
jgi:hypothetical protein